MTQLSKRELLAQQAAAYAETAEDMTQETKGGGGGKVLETGTYMARFIKYIEMGNHPQSFEGKSTGNALEFRLGLAIFVIKPGVPFDKNNPDTYEVSFFNTFNLKHSRNAKAKAFKLFKRMNYKGVHKTFPQLLGEAFMVKVEKYQGEDKKDRNKLDFDSFAAPIDPLSQAYYPVPDVADEHYQQFLWAAPTIEAWNDLYIEGKNDDGKSKNYIQDKILTAVDFAGSALEGLLLANGMAPQGQQATTLPSLPADAPAPQPEAAAPAAAPAAPANVPDVPGVTLPTLPAFGPAPTAWA